MSLYESNAWRKLRYRALKASSGCCDCCGNRASKDNPLHVDHIKPRSKYPYLELVLTNLQVLCKACNLGKSAWDKTDWRPNAVKKKRIFPAALSGFTYLVRKRGESPRAHIIVDGDTACRLYSSGSILSHQKYKLIDELEENHVVCTLCLRSVSSAARRTANSGDVHANAHHGDCQAQTGSEMPAGGRQSAA